MQYHIDQEVFDKNFKSGKDKRFSHKTNVKFNIFPFTASTSDKALDSFDNILGSFLRTVYSLETPKEINRESIIENICNDVECNDQSKIALKLIIKDLYFVDEHTLRCTGINTYKYAISTKNDQKISEYLVRTICDTDAVKDALECSKTSSNVLDSLVENYLPRLDTKKNSVDYFPMMPNIKDHFTKDLIYIINDKNADYNDIIRLISYYYFFYTSQVILNINRFGNPPTEIIPVFFCTEWERTSVSRDCYNRGWKQIESKLKTMFSHAVLLEMLNQTADECTKKYDYSNLLQEYGSVSDDEKERIFSEIEELKKRYITEYAEPVGFEYSANNYTKGDLNSLIKGFFDDIMLQFESTTRSRANEAYKNSFYAFSRNNFLQNRKKNGLMLILTEEMLVLMTKVAIGNEKQIRLNRLFREFNQRGIFMDKQTQESIVSFYEKLNIIEKKSDSGDAQYVKGIL